LCLLFLSLFYLLHSVEVRSQHFRDDHTPVGLLAVFQNRDKRPPDGKPRPIERMNVLGLILS